MHDDRTGPRRYLIATAIAHYPNAPHWDRTELAAARDQVVALFTQDLGYEHVSDLGLNPTRGQLAKLLRDFSRDPARRSDDLVAVYIGGHGEVLDSTGEHVLLTADTDPDDIEDALPTAELARKLLLGTRVRRVLLMLDTCYSGQGGNELTAAAVTSMTTVWGDDPGSGLVVISSTQPAEQAQTGAFPRLLHDAIHSLPTAGYNPDTLPLDSVVKAMNAHAAKPGHQTIGSSVAGLTGEIPPFLPNPRHDPGMTDVDLAIQHASEWEVQAERRDVEFRTRLLVRAMGGSSHSFRDGWWFVGRHTALLDITAWLHHPSPARPLLAVTGSPGSGKTAVLGLIATLTHPDRRVTVPLRALGLPAAAVPRSGEVDVAIYAQGLTSEQVLQGIAAAARLDAAAPGQLLEQLTHRTAPLTVLIDALDEATDPDHLARYLLRPLVEHSDGRLRLIVGTRPYLLDRLEVRREQAIDLDADRYADLEALTTYAARGLLEANPRSPYLRQPARLIRAVADAVAEAAQPSFLVARITSATLAAQDGVADPRDPAWRRSLPSYPGEAMRRDLETRLGDNAAKVRDLLRPLAFAEGQGLPWEDIWAAVASHAARATYTDDDLLWLRRDAGSYVVEATEGGRSTYRLYHQALAEHLRDGADSTGMHRAIAQVLHNRVPRTLDGRRDWTRAHPYTLRHLATHAAHAGLLDSLITDTDYLVHADPGNLLPALHETTTDDGDLIAAIYRCSADIHHALPASRRRQVMATDAARFKAVQLQRDLSTPLTWSPRWATGRQTNHALRTTFTGHINSVITVACSMLEGRPVAVTADYEGVARVWNIATAEEVAVFTGHTRLVNAVACSVLEGRPVAVTADYEGVARVWNIATAEEVAVFTGHTRLVNAVACSVLEGRPVAVTADYEGIVRVWDLATAEEITVFTGHTDTVDAVACTTLDGRPIAVTTSYDGTARVWDLATAEEITVFTGHARRLIAVACCTLEGRPTAVTTSYDGTARVWDLTTADEITVFTGHSRPVIAVTCSMLGDRPIAVTASDDRTARVWDLATAEEITVFTGHTAPVKAVACSTLDGRPVAITGSDDGTARVWLSLTPPSRPPTRTGHSGEITDVTCTVLDGRPIAVTASNDGTAHVWDLAAAEEIIVFTGHTDSVIAVACTVLDGRPIAVTGSDDRTARVWDLATAEEITVFTGHTNTVDAVACGTLDGRPIAVTTSSDGVARVWDLATAGEITVFTGHTNTVDAVACGTLDGRPIAVTTSSDGVARVWDLATAEEITVFTGHTRRLIAVTCSALEGRPIAVTTSYDGTARVWDLATAEEITVFTGHTRPVIAVSCSAFEGRPAAITAGIDNTARAWNLATADGMGIFDFRGINRATVGPSGELVVAMGWDLVVLDRTATH